MIRLKHKPFYRNYSNQPKIYLKNSLVRFLGVDRKILPENFVESNYNMFG